VNLKRAEFVESNEPIDNECNCMVCQRHSRGYVRHLFQVGEPTASRLVSYHNVAWTLALMDQARSAIIAGTFQSLRKQVLDVWATVA
jgi:queuine tRNA-ribosyltransferase